MLIRLPHHYSPRSYQRRAFVAYADGIRRFMCVWHRRSGKDKTWLNFTICRMMERKGLYAHILPTYKQAKGIIWDGIGADGFGFMEHFPPELVAGKNETELKVELANGSIYRLLGSDNTDQLVGMNPVGLVFSEYAIQDPTAWALLSPILVENQGWASFIFTPRGKNHAFDLWESNKNNPDWYCNLLNIEQTWRDAEGEGGGPVMTLADVEREIASGNIDADTAKQEYYCDFAGTFAGSYYGTLITELHQKDQIRSIVYDPSLPVFTVWDLGRHDATAIWFVQSVRGFEYRIIDYYEEEGYPLDYHIRQVRLKPYVYAEHYAPHDINVTEYTTGVSRIEAARRLGINFWALPKLPIYDGIAAARAVLPKCWFDATKCARGLKALQNYHREYDDKNRVYRDIPVHDWSSHGADAWRYFATALSRLNNYTNSAVVVEKEFDVLRNETIAETEFNLWDS
jgi:hypothetical protein